WIDEIEKGLSGSDSGGSDGGTATRVFGNLLTWMQEKKSPVFVFATANSIENLPPELLRKGRFDEIFFIDFPSEEERREIFSIMIKGCKIKETGKSIERDPSNFDLDKLVEMSGESVLGENIRLTGSEIEAVVKDALLRAFYRKTVEKKDVDMNTDDIIAAMAQIYPLAKSRKDSIKKIRDWAKDNALSASVAPPTKVATNVATKEVSSGRNITF
nr:AAA family ATPase [Lachnospiraceae bacterium]